MTAGCSGPTRRGPGAGGVPNPDPGLDGAVAALRAGAVVAVPTDTVYGLAVDPSVPGSTDALFALKARPESLDLPVLVATVGQFEDLAVPGALPPVARRLAQSFWPGALTIVVPRRPGLGWALGAHGDTIGVRCPDHPTVLRLCADVGPLATTSANLHGAPPCHDAAAVARTFGVRVAVVVDGGRCARPPSTVVAVTGEDLRCLREGALSFSDVAEVARAG